jgi:hypothetical protein
MNYVRDGLTTILQVHIESLLVSVAGCIFCLLLWRRARGAAIWGLLGFMTYIGAALLNTAGAEIIYANHARSTLGETLFYVFIGFMRGFTLLFLLLAILANRKVPQVIPPPGPRY